MNQIPDPLPAGAGLTYEAPAAATHRRGLGRVRRSKSDTRPSPARSFGGPARSGGGRSARSSGGGGFTTTHLVVLVLLVLGGLAAAAASTGVLQFGTPSDLGVGAKTDGSTSGVGGDTWSYYHDQKYETDSTGPKWETDRTRSTDPDEAVLGSTSRWEYDGPYRYGPYGNDGMNRRASGRETADPLYSQAVPGQDVFSEYGGDLDPSGGAPVGAPPSNYSSPYYDPYGGYSNPYANRIRLAYGEGYGRGAASAAAIP